MAAIMLAAQNGHSSRIEQTKTAGMNNNQIQFAQADDLTHKQFLFKYFYSSHEELEQHFIDVAAIHVCLHLCYHGDKTNLAQ